MRKLILLGLVLLLIPIALAADSTDPSDYINYDMGGEPALNGTTASHGDPISSYGWIQYWSGCEYYHYNNSNVYVGSLAIKIGKGTPADCGWYSDLGAGNILNTSEGQGVIDIYFYDCGDNTSCRDSIIMLKASDNTLHYAGYASWMSNYQYCYYDSSAHCGVDREQGYHRLRVGYNNTHLWTRVDNTHIYSKTSPDNTKIVTLKGSDTSRAGSSWFDNYRVYTGQTPPQIGTIPPVIISYNCTSCVTDPTPDTAPYQTNDTTPTFNITTDINADCAIADVNLNYTAMTDGNAARNCTPTGSTGHICTLQPSDALILNETDYTYIGCKDSDGNENTTSTSRPLEISILKVEVQGKDAILEGITGAIPSAVIYSDQQVYVRTIDNNQALATFDKVAIYGSQRWAFNYLTAGESSIGTFYNLTPAFYFLEMTNLASNIITDHVGELINSTKT